MKEVTAKKALKQKQQDLKEVQKMVVIKTVVVVVVHPEQVQDVQELQSAVYLMQVVAEEDQQVNNAPCLYPLKGEKLKGLKGFFNF